MKINNQPDNFLETNIKDVESKDFGIGDSSIIIDILRNRLYQYKIATMVQEYLCNARDAHREIGQTKKIEVGIPNALFPFFRVRDYGPGISPSRINDVFIFYGKSTKRVDNTQTGGFGIGAKSAWAYTDSFTITTYINGIKRIYIAHTGQNKEGKLDFISETNTDEANGTEITIAIEPKDWFEVNQAIARAIFFWTKEECPVNKESLQETSRYIPHLTFKNGAIYNSLPHLRVHTSLVLVVDGIMYEYPNFKPEIQLGNVVVLHLKVGEVEVNANRESVVLNDANTALIKQKYDDYQEEFFLHMKELGKKVSSLEEYLKYYKEYSVFSAYINFEYEYKGQKIIGDRLTIPNPQQYSLDSASFERTHRYGSQRTHKVYLSYGQQVYSEVHLMDVLSKYFINDCIGVSKASLVRRLEAYFTSQGSTNIRSIKIINLLDTENIFTELGCKKLSEVLPPDVKVSKPRNNIPNILVRICGTKYYYGKKNTTKLNLNTAHNLKYISESFYVKLEERYGYNFNDMNDYLSSNHNISVYYVVLDKDIPKVTALGSPTTLCIEPLLEKITINQDRIESHIMYGNVLEKFGAVLHKDASSIKIDDPLLSSFKGANINCYDALTGLEKEYLVYTKHQKKYIKRLLKAKERFAYLYPLMSIITVRYHDTNDALNLTWYLNARYKQYLEKLNENK